MADETDMADQANTTTTWVRWGIGLMVVILAQIAAVAYFAGGNATRIENNERRIIKLEAESVTKERFQRVEDDVREIKTDVKELIKEKRR